MYKISLYFVVAQERTIAAAGFRLWGKASEYDRVSSLRLLVLWQRRRFGANFRVGPRDIQFLPLHVPYPLNDRPLVETTNDIVCVQAYVVFAIVCILCVASRLCLPGATLRLALACVDTRVRASIHVGLATETTTGGSSSVKTSPTATRSEARRTRQARCASRALARQRRWLDPVRAQTKAVCNYALTHVSFLHANHSSVRLTLVLSTAPRAARRAVENQQIHGKSASAQANAELNTHAAITTSLHSHLPFCHRYHGLGIGSAGAFGHKSGSAPVTLSCFPPSIQLPVMIVELSKLHST